jgi:hypothetical protein
MHHFFNNKKDIYSPRTTFKSKHEKLNVLISNKCLGNYQRPNGCIFYKNMTAKDYVMFYINTIHKNHI